MRLKKPNMASLLGRHDVDCKGVQWVMHDVVKISAHEVACDGHFGEESGAESRHPKVYLAIKNGESSVTCPYCGVTYSSDV